MSAETFLRRRVRNAAILNALGSVVALVAGSVAVVLTFWAVYGAIYFGFQWLVPHSHQTRLLVAAAFVVLLFIGNARTSREYLTTYEVDTIDGREPYTFQVPELGVLSNLNFFSPNTINSLTKVLAQLMFIGPQWITAAFRLASQAAFLRRLPLAACAQLVEKLRQHAGRVPFTTLLPSGHDETSAGTLRDLLTLDAIQLLDGPPAGAMLTSTFRHGLNRAMSEET